MLTRGAQSERPKKRRQSGVVDIDGSLRPGGALASVGEDVGCDEYIDQRHGRFREIKAASGRRSALNWNRFRRPFHPDCTYGYEMHAQ